MRWIAGAVLVGATLACGRSDLEDYLYASGSTASPGDGAAGAGDSAGAGSSGRGASSADGSPSADGSSPLDGASSAEAGRSGDASGTLSDDGSGEDRGGAEQDAPAGEAAVPFCSTSSCTGCCTPDGICAQGDQTIACGVGGEPCQACAASQTCASGQCQ